MGRRRSAATAGSDTPQVEQALAAVDAEDLRELVRYTLLELDDRAHARVVARLLDRAARSCGWTPDRPTPAFVASAVSFARAAMDRGYADPDEVHDYLQQASSAFLARDYAAARAVLRAFLQPLGEGEIDLGQHETADEVLGVDLHACAAQHVVAVYMTTPGAERPRAALAAIEDVSSVGFFWRPIEELERVAVEPLPDLETFLPEWRRLVAERPKPRGRRGWETNEDRWLREVVQRLEGAEGLAKVARSTRRPEDLRAWCRFLVESEDWKGALAAHDEAVRLLPRREHARGEFLDGAALAARQLGRKNLPSRLARAWVEAPSMLRLRRWLGAARTKAALRKRVRQALEAVPKKAHRQRALLHVLLADHGSAAKLLAAAPGLGWSEREHPGHLLFPLFQRLLGGERPATALQAVRALDIEEAEWVSSDQEEPRLATPVIAELLEQAGVAGPLAGEARGGALEAMREAAEKRVVGVTTNKRRRHYGHAAQLVATCAALDSTPEATRWVSRIRADYRRYPALQRALDDRLGLGTR